MSREPVLEALHFMTKAKNFMTKAKTCALLTVVACSSNTDGTPEPNPTDDSGLTESGVADAAPHSSPIKDSGKDTSVNDSDLEAGDDADTDAGDASTGAIDSGVVCGAKLSSGYVGLGDSGKLCGTEEDYGCSVDKYTILCECPANTCKCQRNGLPVASVAYSGCPACSGGPTFSSIASSCGIPY